MKNFILSLPLLLLPINLFAEEVLLTIESSGRASKTKKMRLYCPDNGVVQSALESLENFKAEDPIISHTCFLRGEKTTEGYLLLGVLCPLIRSRTTYRIPWSYIIYSPEGCAWGTH